MVEILPRDEHNEFLVSNVHPSDWTNPTPDGRYNLVVIGAGTAGLVTLEDLLEEIVGEIRDEHEPEEAPLRRSADGSWIINAAVHVDKLTELFGVEFAQRDFDTIGGLVVSELGHVPREGETLEFRSLFIEVLVADHRRVRVVRIGQQPSSESARAGS